MGIIRPLRRNLRAPGKFAQAILRWKRFRFDDVPPLFGNAKPKSGSHLMLQIFSGFTQIMPYAYVDAEPVRTITKAGERRAQSEVLADLQHLPSGVIGWGYLEPTAENVAFLSRPGRINYFVYRDPRDLLVSQVHFATDMREEHGMHAFYKSLPDFGERLKVAITGIDRDGVYMVGVKQRYDSVFQWQETPGVLCIRFEDLIDRRDVTLNAMLDEVEKTGYRIPTPRDQSLATLIEAIRPEKSHTFRSGTTGAWREHFTDEHKKLFKDTAGDLIVRLGYEKNNDW
jgi:hypothetical protein